MRFILLLVGTLILRRGALNCSATVYRRLHLQPSESRCSLRAKANLLKRRVIQLIDAQSNLPRPKWRPCAIRIRILRNTQMLLILDTPRDRPRSPLAYLWQIHWSGSA
jgi:hypothetical protein